MKLVKKVLLGVCVVGMLFTGMNCAGTTKLFAAGDNLRCGNGAIYVGEEVKFLAHSDNIQCENGIVRVGNSTDTVIKIAGVPEIKRKRVTKRVVHFSRLRPNVGLRMVEVEIEHWFYRDLRYHGVTYYYELIFKDGILEDIKSFSKKNA